MYTKEDIERSIVQRMAKGIQDRMDADILKELTFVLPSRPGDIIECTSDGQVFIAITSQNRNNESYVLESCNAEWRWLNSAHVVL